MHIFNGTSVCAKEESRFERCLDCSLPYMETLIKNDWFPHNSSCGSRFALLAFTRFFLLIAMASDDGTTRELVTSGEPTWRKCE